MLDALGDPEHRALVGWIVSAAGVVLGGLGGLVGVIAWFENQNRKDHRDLGGRIDKLYQLLLERLPPKA